MLASYRADIAQQGRGAWPTMEQILRGSVGRHREQALAALASPARRLNDRERTNIDSLAAAVLKLADVLREREQPETVSSSISKRSAFSNGSTIGTRKPS